MSDQFKDMIRERMADSETLPEALIQAAGGYTADFESRGTDGSIAGQFGQFDRSAAVTGLYFPENRLMFMDNRANTHHNDQWKYVVRGLGPLSPVLPWASATTFDGDYVVELGRSHGGLIQAITRGGHDDVKRLNSGMDISPEMVLDVAYAARLTDHPAQDTEYDVAFAGPEINDLPDRLKNEIGVRRQTLDMADVYDLLRTTPAGLPEPLFERARL